MLSVLDKMETRRFARAQAFVRAAAATLERLKADDLPKKGVLAAARVAGLLAAKRTPEWIPDCHPLPLDYAEVRLEIREGGVGIEAEAACIAKTGVEMEALTAAAAAALTVVDMLKGVDDSLEIVGIRLLEKRGGRSDFAFRIPSGFRAAVVVTSDRSFEGRREDKTGRLLMEFLRSQGVAEVSYHLLPDDRERIREKLQTLADSGTRLILTTGGTGLSPRDVTVEAARDVLERELPGVAEAARAFGQRRTPYAMLSRGVAGLRGDCLIVTLPGSRRGVEESLVALFPALFHAYKPLAAGRTAGAPQSRGETPCG